MPDPVDPFGGGDDVGGVAVGAPDPEGPHTPGRREELDRAALPARGGDYGGAVARPDGKPEYGPWLVVDGLPGGRHPGGRVEGHDATLASEVEEVAGDVDSPPVTRHRHVVDDTRYAVFGRCPGVADEATPGVLRPGPSRPQISGHGVDRGDLGGLRDRHRHGVGADVEAPEAAAEVQGVAMEGHG